MFGCFEAEKKSKKEKKNSKIFNNSPGKKKSCFLWLRHGLRQRIFERLNYDCDLQESYKRFFQKLWPLKRVWCEKLKLMNNFG